MAAYTPKRNNLETLFHFVLNFGRVTCLLPLSSDATFILKVVHNFRCFVSILNIFGTLTLLVLTAYRNLDQIILVSELLSIVMIYAELFFNVLLWQFKNFEFQEFLRELKDFFADSEDYKQKIMNKYFNRYKYLYIFFTTFIIGTYILRVIIAPILQRRKLPYEFDYPFTTEPNSVVYYLIFCSQSIAAFLSGAQLIFPMLIAMVFLHAATKLELLVYNLNKVKNPKEFTLWIEQHLDCIRHIEHINQVLGVVIMKTYIILGLTIIFGSMELIYGSSVYVIARTFGTVTSALVITYVYNGPADDIHEMSEVLRYSLYNLDWCDKLANMSKLIIISMNRMRKPLVISPLQGLMPALNRRIYTNFLSNLISYIMMLRAIVNSQ